MGLEKGSDTEATAAVTDSRRDLICKIRKYFMKGLQIVRGSGTSFFFMRHKIKQSMYVKLGKQKLKVKKNYFHCRFI
jgi:hypothetical protein